MIMNKNLRILYIEDNADEREGLKEVLSGQKMNGHTMIIDCEPSFDKAIEKSQNYHIVILDLYRGDATNGGKEVGSEIFKKVRDTFFVPIVFYSGNIAGIKDLKSQVVGVASKGGEIDELKSEIERLTRHNLPFLKESIHECIEDEFKRYFWDVIQEQNDKFRPDAADYSLGYMLLRNFADSLSKNNIKRIVCDDSIKEDKVHPMEFYIYPINDSHEVENGEILRKKDGDDIFVVLTPSCDFVERFKKNGESDGRSAEKILIVRAKPLSESEEYKNYVNSRNKDNTDKLKRLINASRGDRYFFLPQTPFIDNCVLDFQLSSAISYDELKNQFIRIAKLDNPYAQSMVSSFIRYYDRIGFPDIDTDYVLNHL